MTTKHKIVTVSSICAVCLSSVVIGEFPAHADDFGTAVYNGVNWYRQTCPAVREDSRLTAAAQLHALDIIKNGVDGHVGSDGSSPQDRIAAAGYSQTGYTGEIVYWGTGSLATAQAALDLWMQSPAHRAIILDCAFTAGGFATASDGNKLTAVGDFARP
ncbi:MAG: CAP domain-containing protein [Candidatus Sericytochromatia bacterium]